MLGEQIKDSVEKQYEYFESGETLSYDFRINQLKKLKKLVQYSEEEIFEALNKDLDKHKFEAYTTEVSAISTNEGEL